MHTRIPSHGLKRSGNSCPRGVNAGNKNTQHVPPTKTECDYLSMDGFKKTHTTKNKNKQTNKQKQVTYAKISPKMVNPRDIARNIEEEEEEKEEGENDLEYMG